MAYTSKALHLKANHTWRTSPGHKLVVLERGVVRFEYPEDWLVGVEEGHMAIRDRAKPHDNCNIGVSYFRFPVGGRQLNLDEMLMASIYDDPRDIETGTLQNASRPGLDAVWIEKRYQDENFETKEPREAYSRVLITHSFGVVCLVTCAYWVDEAEKYRRVWENLLNSMVLAERIADPTMGPVPQ